MKNYHLLRKVCAGFLIVALLQISGGDLAAQARNEIQVWIINSRTLKPIHAAVVVLDKTAIGTFTDLDGNFSLNMPDSLVKRKFKLPVSMIGYVLGGVLIKKKEPSVKRDFLLDPEERR